MSRRSLLAACLSVPTLACGAASPPAALGAERSLYLYCEAPKFFPATYNDHAGVDWWFAEDGVLDDDVFCIRLTSDLVLWTGVCWLHDEGDAGWSGPGVDLSGVSRVEFRARRGSGGSGSQIKVEAIDGAELRWVSLAASWQEYAIPITHPADRVRNLFSVILDPALSPQTVYLDDIRFVYDRPVAPVPVAVAGSIFDRTARIEIAHREFPVAGAGYGVRNSEYEAEDLTALMGGIGANTIRTWGAECTYARLDRLGPAGRKVLVGYWLPVSADFEANYFTPAGRHALGNDLCAFLQSFRDEPAVLGWLLGNEVYHSLRSGWSPEQRERYFTLLDSLIVLAKSVDPDHPVGCAEAGLAPLTDPGGGDSYLARLVPHLDFYGSNMYGELLEGGLSRYLHDCAGAGYDQPILLTEFGPRGWWEIPDSLAGFNDPANDALKAQEIRTACDSLRACSGFALGGCVFDWVDKLEQGVWTRWGIFGGAGTGDLSRLWRLQAQAVAEWASGIAEPAGPQGHSDASPAAAAPGVPEALGCRPNPCRDRVGLRFRLPGPAPARIEIHDVSGRVVLREEIGLLEGGEHQGALALTGLAGGTYFLSVATDRGAAAQQLTIVR